jgi:tetratricopeptide (TPR) repeat protein
MTDTQTTSIKLWTAPQALLVSVACLVVGVAGGWFVHGSPAPAAVAAAAGKGNPATVTAPAAVTGNAANPAIPAPAPSAAQLKQQADAQAAPLIEKLKTDPKNPDLLVGVANLYYDAQQYQTAIDFYHRALDARPAEAAVRTDMATAYWYLGNTDMAISEFNKALTYSPNNPNTLFNLGLVRWKGRNDAAGAIADWEKLLKTNPGYEGRAKVEQMLAAVRQQTASGAADSKGK